MGLPINTIFTKYMTTFTLIINLEPGLENSMDCIVHGVTKNPKGLTDFHFHSPRHFPPLSSQTSGTLVPNIYIFSPLETETFPLGLLTPAILLPDPASSFQYFLLPSEEEVFPLHALTLIQPGYLHHPFSLASLD